MKALQLHSTRIRLSFLAKSHTCLYTLLLAAALSSCTPAEKDPCHETVQTFSEAFFNYRYLEALEYCTPESRQTVHFLASGIGQEQVEAIQSAAHVAQCKIYQLDKTTDSTAVADVEVRHFLDIAPLEEQPRDTTINCRLFLLQRKSLWKVHLTQWPAIH
ncbi:MAG: hypothetical protein ACI350_00530 [Prevotella sp.]